jgi:plastocyanin domain-containing protein
MNEIIVTISGIVGVVFTYWFFLIKKEKKEMLVTDSVDIIVEGGYSPEVISIPKNKTTKINFIRKDSSSCLEEVVLPDFKIRKYLPLNEKIVIEINPKQTGEFNFTCGMNMFHGKIIVTD